MEYKDKVWIKINSEQFSISGKGADCFLLDALAAIEDPKESNATEGDGPQGTIEINTEGTVESIDGNLVFSYDETELTGMEGASTSVSFREDDTGIVTMMRTGTVRTVLVFEEGRRNICAYETEFFPIELTVHTYVLKNSLTSSGGELYIDYVLEMQGGAFERSRFRMDVRLADGNSIGES